MGTPVCRAMRPVMRSAARGIRASAQPKVEIEKPPSIASEPLLVSTFAGIGMRAGAAESTPETANHHKRTMLFECTRGSQFWLQPPFRRLTRLNVHRLNARAWSLDISSVGPVAYRRRLVTPSAGG